MISEERLPALIKEKASPSTQTPPLPASHASEELATPAVFLAILDELRVNRDDTVLRGDQRMSAPRGRSHTQVEFHRAGRVAGLPG